jgi:MoxR-like ATPase
MNNKLERDNIMNHRDQLVEAWKQAFGDLKVLDRSEVNKIAGDAGLKEPNQNFLSKLRVGRNQFSIANYGQALQIMPQAKWGDRYRKPKIVEDARVVQHETAIKKVDEAVSFVPSPDPNYIKAGYFAELVKIMNSGMFIPTFITGLSGMGKTKEVFEAAAKTKRELIRVNITIETDEDDLLGHYTLKNGETIWEDGPIIVAMERGAVLLLDEVDLASNKIMCLQPVLEGGDIFLKKINRLVKPSPGFNIIATANTKGKGSDDGRFIGTNILNEAFLDRFPITFEHDYPNASTEKKIITKVLGNYQVEDPEFVEHLVQWTDVIRRTFDDGGIDEIISTRRLVNIVNSYMVFKDKSKAIEYSINRFDEDTKKGFMDLWTKVDPSATPELDEDDSYAGVKISEEK